MTKEILKLIGWVLFNLAFILIDCVFAFTGDNMITRSVFIALLIFQCITFGVFLVFKIIDLKE